MLERAFVPYGAYWSTPFCRWQGSLAQEHALDLAARVARSALAARSIAPNEFDGLYLGTTVIQRQGFYGAPWVAALIGAEGITGPTISQACATSARIVASAATEIEVGTHACALTIGADRTSNGPHVYYPNPSGPGGRGDREDPVLDSFEMDPWGRVAMIDTAENAAKAAGIDRATQDQVALVRSAQYQEALANDRAFHKRFMVAAEIPKSKKETLRIEADEGIHPTTAEGLAKLRPVREGGTVTYGTQTHPADGNAGMVVCDRAHADRLSKDKSIVVRIVSFGEARVQKAHMPMAPVPAARMALERAGVSIRDCKVIKTHNPFAVNDAYFCKEMGVSIESVNPFGSPLIYGHPQGPTGLRALIETIELLAMQGGGVGLFSGCAAGDTAMSVVVRVG